MSTAAMVAPTSGISDAKPAYDSEGARERDAQDREHDERGGPGDEGDRERTGHVAAHRRSDVVERAPQPLALLRWTRPDDLLGPSAAAA
jgi:hypothetical protein